MHAVEPALALAGGDGSSGQRLQGQARHSICSPTRAARIRRCGGCSRGDASDRDEPPDARSSSTGARIAVWPGRERPMTSDKIRPHHRDRKAILYVRQSSIAPGPAQRREPGAPIRHAERLQALGWAEIEIIDDDLGRSAAGSVARAGFERMVAEVCLGKVGAVAAWEVSRFARNSRDWQQLIEMCRWSTRFRRPGDGLRAASGQ